MARPSSTESNWNGRRPTKAIAATIASATVWNTKSPPETPSSSPNSTRVRSPTKVSEREVMMTPSASMPTNSRPMAVSPESLNRRCTTETPPIITIAPTMAPYTPEIPSNSAPAIPGRMPCARASPTNANPRRITNVPAIAQVSPTNNPPTRARRMNSLSKNGVNRPLTTVRRRECRRNVS